jgi:predicted NUDIX family phosphoesterase
LIKKEIDMDEKKLGRRRLLKYLGVSSAGVAFASAAAITKKKIKSIPSDAKEELEKLKIETEKLKQSYEHLDKRSKLILRVLLVTSGLDIFISI